MSKKIDFSGNTNLSFFPVGIGTASLAGINMVNDKNYLRPSSLDIEKLLNCAFDLTNKNGSEIVMIDTSSQYDESEKRLSEFINKNPKKLEKMYICTKWGLKFSEDDFSIQDYSLENLNTSLKRSLDYLKKIDLFYIHTNPSVTTKTLEKIMDKDDDIVKKLNELKINNYGGIKKIGISVSSEKNLEFIIENKYLSDVFDVIQLNANILLNRSDLVRQLNLLKKKVVLNSLYRKSDKKIRSSLEGRKKIFFESLSLCNNVILLSGTKNIEHLNECFKLVEEFNSFKPLKITCFSKEPGLDSVKDKIEKDLESYFEKINQTNKKSISSSKSVISNKNDLIKYIVDAYIGSLKTRIGPAPDSLQFDILFDIIKYYVNKNIPIDTILSWGPKKFFSGINESFVDLSELLSLQTLLELNSKIQEKYLPGALFTIFIEDFEGKFIEGEKLNSVFDNYITSFENLVKIVGLNNIIRIVRTDDLLKTNFDIKKINFKLDENYSKLKKYWQESDIKGIDGSENYESYKEINKIGWYEKIGNDTRDYYLNRLDRMLGNTKSHEEKVDMTVRLLACVLIHRQFGVFKVNDFMNPVKLSFLKISGGPKKIMNGRIDIRTIPANISKRHISAWASKGCLKLKKNNYLPTLHTWREVEENKSNFIKAKISIQKMYGEISFETSIIKK